MQDPVSATRPQQSPSTPATELADWLSVTTEVSVHGDLDVAVSGMSLSTSRVRPGDLYAALPGARAHGADFAVQALEAGAVVVLTDAAGLDRLPPGTPALGVGDPRRVLGRLAARIYGEPATALRVIGVTGTQGKTTTTRVLDQGLAAAGVTSAVIGTVGTRIAGEDVRTQLTTPEAPDLHGLFAVMRERGVDTCAMEVSSHALVLGRVDGVVFDVATFLNLGRDHLDFHDTVDDYFAAKASLFTPERAAVGLTNVDDEFGRRLLDVATIAMSTYSLHDPDADWRAVDIDLGPAGATFTVLGPGGVEVPAGIGIPGEFNVSNALAAIASAALAGLDPRQVADGIARVGGVPGRLEPVSAGQDFTVVVDYAHKPDALEAVLATLRPLTDGQVLVVVGAGGDRDTVKRPVMGEIAARLADVVVVTDDNPRTEDAAAIRAAVLAGARGPAEVVEVGDRRLAIREAVRRARPGDVVLVAGKGHETGQQVGDVVHPFDDRVVAAEEVRALAHDRQGADDLHDAGGRA